MLHLLLFLHYIAKLNEFTEGFSHSFILLAFMFHVSWHNHFGISAKYFVVLLYLSHTCSLCSFHSQSSSAWLFSWMNCRGKWKWAWPERWRSSAAWSFSPFTWNNGGKLFTRAKNVKIVWQSATGKHFFIDKTKNEIFVLTIRHIFRIYSISTCVAAEERILPFFIFS